MSKPTDPGRPDLGAAIRAGFVAATAVPERPTMTRTPLAIKAANRHRRISEKVRITREAVGFGKPLTVAETNEIVRARMRTPQSVLANIKRRGP